MQDSFDLLAELFARELGPLDLLGEVPGLGTFEHVDAASSEIEAVSRSSPSTVSRAGKAVGRPTDLVGLGYIRALRS